MITHKNVINTIENLFNYILTNNEMQYNTPMTRAIFADKFKTTCDSFVKGGLISEVNVFCNENNNTPIVIDSNSVIVDTNIKMDSVIYWINSYISLNYNSVVISSECMNGEEYFINDERLEKLNSILNKKEIIEI